MLFRKIFQIGLTYPIDLTLVLNVVKLYNSFEESLS